MGKKEKIFWGFLLLLMAFLTCKWSPLYGSSEQSSSTQSTSNQSNDTAEDGLLYPLCREVQGVVFAEVTSVENDGYHLTEYGDTFSMDADWHYLMDRSMVPFALNAGDVIKVEVRRSLPGVYEKVIRFDSGGYEKSDMPLEKVGVFSRHDCYVSPLFTPPDNGEPEPENSQRAESPEQQPVNEADEPDTDLIPEVNTTEGCWSPFSPPLSFFPAVRHTPLGNLYWWEDKRGAPCLE